MLRAACCIDAWVGKTKEGLVLSAPHRIPDAPSNPAAAC